MPFLIICIAILLFFVFLLLLKVTLTVSYADEVKLFARVLFFKIKIIPSRDKKYPHSMSARKAAKLKKKRIKKLRKKLEKKRAKEEEKESAKKSARSDKEKGEKKSPQEILDIISLVCSLVTKVTKTFFRHLRIKLARINIKVASEDAATTAVAYGAVTQSINILFPLLDSIKTVKKPKGKNINIYADFCSEEPEIDIEIAFSLRVWHVIHVAFVALFQLIKYYFKSAQTQAEGEEIAEAVQKRAKTTPAKKKKKKKANKAPVKASKKS